MRIDPGIFPKLLRPLEPDGEDKPANEHESPVHALTSIQAAHRNILRPSRPPIPVIKAAVPKFHTRIITVASRS